MGLKESRLQKPNKKTSELEDLATEATQNET